MNKLFAAMAKATKAQPIYSGALAETLLRKYDERFIAVGRANLGNMLIPHPESPLHIFTSEGEVWSIHKEKPKKLKLSLCAGYPALKLGGRTKHVHAFICEVFNGPRPSRRHQVRHLDGNRLNARHSNLAWGLPVENAADKIAHGTVLSGERNPMSVLDREKVAAMRRLRSNGLTFKQIAEQFDVAAMTALRAVKGESWK